jgi:chaperonin GroES
MKFKPLYDKLLIKRDDAEEVSPGGIFIPKAAEETPSKGVVVAAGEGYRTESGALLDLKVKVGDQIIFGKYAGSEVVIDGEKFIIIEEENVLGIIE